MNARSPPTQRPVRQRLRSCRAGSMVAPAWTFAQHPMISAWPMRHADGSGVSQRVLAVAHEPTRRQHPLSSPRTEPQRAQPRRNTPHDTAPPPTARPVPPHALHFATRTVPTASHTVPTNRPTRVALIGAGFIADAHVQALRSLPTVALVAVCDPAPGRAQAFAKKHGIAHACSSLGELQALGTIDAVHVLTPPHLHADLALQALAAGWHVLVEKPLVLRSADVAPLQRAAADAGRVLAVNHNQTAHPAIARLQAHLAAGKLGRLDHVAIQHHVPLRQLQTGDVGHFMFQTEANILLEQGVHLFAVVFALLGAARSVRAIAGARTKLPNGVDFVGEWLLHLDCERGTASVRMAFGQPMLETTVQAIGS
ncbi:MAG: Gfo/Idh/MocA family oxidoreductase, partial [Planctomycetes bacterium]|nr:Gfo/Idh/MocA family oxidoreductase [Planctomycetota bacterium]